MPKHRITKDLSRRMDSIGKSMLEIAKHPDARLTEKQIAMLQQSILDIDSARAAIRNLLAEYHADPEAAHGPSRTKYRGKPQGISTGELIADLMELGIVKYRRDYYRKLARSAFPDLANSLIMNSAGNIADPYLVLADFEDYCRAQNEADALYRDVTAWNRKGLVNTAKAGIFAADRSVLEYDERIWHLTHLN